MELLLSERGGRELLLVVGGGCPKEAENVNRVNPKMSIAPEMTKVCERERERERTERRRRRF